MAQRLSLVFLLALILGGSYLILNGLAGSGPEIDPALAQPGNEEPGNAKAVDPLSIEDEQGQERGANDTAQLPTRENASGQSSLTELFALLVQDSGVLQNASVSLVPVPAAASHGQSKHKALTDDSGQLHMTDLPSGKYQLLVEHAKVPLAYLTAAFSIEAGQRKDLEELRIPQASIIRARLLSAVGAPIADARIELGVGGFADFLRHGPGLAPPSTSDARGFFVIRRVKKGDMVLRVDHSSYMRLERKLSLKEGEIVDLGTLVLSAGRQIEGVVVDKDGKGITDARIFPKLHSRLAETTAKGYSASRFVKTDSEGRFKLAGLGENLRLKVEREGYQRLYDVEVDLDQPPVRLTMLAERGIYGKVTGVPEGLLRNTRVHIASKRRGNVGLSPGDFTLTAPARCDDQGRFTFEKLKRGQYRLMADLDGFGISEAVDVKLGRQARQDIELLLVKGPSLELVVLDHLGRPLEGATIRLRWVDPELSERRRRNAGFLRRGLRLERRDKSPTDGIVKFAGLFVGPAQVDVRHPKNLPIFGMEIELRAGVQRQEIRLKQGGWIQGTCMDSSGKPSIKTRITLRRKKEKGTGGNIQYRIRESWSDERRPVTENVVTDSKGEFEVGPLESGTWLVGIDLGGGRLNFGAVQMRMLVGEQDNRSETEVLVIDGQESQVVLRKPVLGAVSGRVTWRGQPVRNARVFAWPKDGDPFNAKRVRSGEDGSYEIGDLKPGSWLLAAKPDKGAVPTTPTAFEVQLAGGSELLDVKLGGAVVFGLIRNKKGGVLQQGLTVKLKPDAGQGAGTKKRSTRIAVMISSDSGGSNMSEMTLRSPNEPEPVAVAAEGRFSIDYVPAGKWRLVISSSESVQLSSKSVDVVENDHLDLGVLLVSRSFSVKLVVLDEAGQPIPAGFLSVYRNEAQEGKKQGTKLERVFGGMVRNGKIRIPGLVAGKYELRLNRIDMIDMTSGKSSNEPSKGELEVHDDGSVTGSTLRVKK